jgi:hypothetical protein
MKSDTETLAAISAGYRRSRDRFDALRRKEIRESDIVSSLPIFDMAFKSALFLGRPMETVGLTRLQRVLFGIDL